MPDLEKSKLKMIKDIGTHFGTTKLKAHHSFRFVFNIWIRAYRDDVGFKAWVDETTGYHPHDDRWPELKI